MEEELKRLRQVELNIKNRINTFELRLSEIKTNDSFDESSKIQTICILREVIEEIKEDLKGKQ